MRRSREDPELRERKGPSNQCDLPGKENGSLKKRGREMYQMTYLLMVYRWMQTDLRVGSEGGSEEWFVRNDGDHDKGYYSESRGWDQRKQAGQTRLKGRTSSVKGQLPGEINTHRLHRVYVQDHQSPWRQRAHRFPYENQTGMKNWVERSVVDEHCAASLEGATKGQAVQDMTAPFQKRRDTWPWRS